MRFYIITIFPEIFNSYFNESILRRAQKKEIVKIKIYNLRDWSEDKYKKIDDAPYGGGAGMVMKIEPLYKALTDIKKSIIKKTKNSKKIRTILLSAKGQTWNQQKIQKYSKQYSDIILICGHYEGVDERILKFINEEISLGDYVMTGGEIGAMAIVDTITRLLPGVLGNANSALDESHSTAGVIEYPHYTRPKIFAVGNKKYTVPKVLLSGDHKKIAAWRNSKTGKTPEH